MVTIEKTEDYFSCSYADARNRFLDAAAACGAETSAYSIAPPHAGEALFIDVAVVGQRDPERAVVVSSGVHGVEGFFGSAVQLACLKDLARRGCPEADRYVLIHAINPFGFAHLRRFNEDNIDLNRNFHANPEDYRGAPEAYRELDPLLNPTSPPSRLEPFLLKALWKQWRVGLPALKQAIAGGQHEYPRGLFYGGHAPAASMRIVQDHIASWVGAAPHVVHLDLHTGLGSYGGYRLLLGDPDNAALAWYEAAFGARFVEPFARPEGTAYRTAGGFGPWLQDRFGAQRYRFATAEFGTYHAIRVLAALRAENRAHFYGSAGSAAVLRAKARLLECFCPRDLRWRRQVLQSGLQLVRQATDAEPVSGA